MKTLPFANGTLLYQNGFLRTFCTDGQEYLRMIYFAVRDKNWSTIPMLILEESIKEKAGGFEINYTAECKQNEIHLKWKCRILADENGTLRFAIDGRAFSDFYRNRIGFCVLHPVRGFENKEVEIIHPNGQKDRSVFPGLIQPHQPFTDIQSMSWHVGPTKIEMEFEGDIFETEDQRNWLDASFKTYCTPLGRPFPVLVKESDEIKQTITLKIRSKAAPQPAKPSTVQLKKENTPFSLPPLGTELSKKFNAPILSGLPLSFLRLEMSIEELETADLSNCPLPIELVLFLDENQVLPRPTSWEKLGGVALHHIVLIDLNRPVLSIESVSKWIPLIRRHLPHVPIGGGSNAYFTDVNRESPPIDLLDFVNFSVNPQVHAFDKQSIAETIETHAFMAQSAREKFRLPVHISPVTIRPRFNPDATGADDTNEKEWKYDLDSTDSFLAAWTLASAIHFAACGINSLCYHRCGDPALDALKYLKPFADKPLHYLNSDIPGTLGGLATENQLLIYNLSDEELHFEIEAKLYSIAGNSIDTFAN